MNDSTTSSPVIIVKEAQGTFSSLVSDECHNSPSRSLAKIQGVGETKFKIPSTSTNRKRKSSGAPIGPISSGLTSDLTDLVLNKRTKFEVSSPLVQDFLASPLNQPAQLSSSTERNVQSSSSSSSEEEQGPGYGYSTPVHQYSTPLSAVPNHIKQLKGFKAVKFVSPAGVTPVQHPLPAPATNLPCPLSLADLDSDCRPCTP